jgi:hypothetical protein
MGGIYRRWGGSPPQAWGSLEHLDGRPAVHVAGPPTFSAFTDFGHHRPTTPTSLDTCMKQFLKIRQTLAGRPRKWGQPAHFGSVGPGLCATSSPHVVLSLAMFYFGHNEDMHGFWSILCFSIIRCSWNGKSTKLMELVSKKHPASISWIKFGYVCSRYVYFMTTNTPAPTHT